MEIHALIEGIIDYLGVSGFLIGLSLLLSLVDWTTDGLLSGIFAYNVNRVFVHGEIHRFFVAPFLHAGLVHFQSNMTVFIIFGPLMEKRIGLENYLILFLLGHVSSTIVSSLIEIWYDTVSVGMSGVIYAFQTAYFMLVFVRLETLWEKIVGYIGMVWVVQDLWKSFWRGAIRQKGDNIDHWGHLGGIIGGIFYVKSFL